MKSRLLLVILATCLSFGGSALAASRAGPHEVELTWMSIANWYFQIGGLRIVMDGYITRVPEKIFVPSRQYPNDRYTFTTQPWKPNVADVRRVRDAISSDGRLDFVLAGHSHFDHTYDVATWALLTGVTIAAYSLVDKAGVRHLDPVPYIALLGLGMSALLAPVVLADRATLAREWKANWRTILVASTMNLTSYLLVLFAFRLSKVGYVVAARELSILFSAFLGTFWLGEGRLGPRLAGAAVVLAGVVCVALAR